MSAFRYAVFGTGRIGTVHAALVRSQGCEVVALGDEVGAAIDAARDSLALGGVPGFTDAGEMAAALAGSVDGVIVASHTKDHARHATPFLAAGLPVYLEKPITDDLNEAFHFCSTLLPGGPGVQLGLQRRFDPGLAHAKQLLADGVIGKVREIRSILRDQFPPPATYTSRGLIIDMGIHVADEVRFLLDEFPSELWASVHHTKAYDSPVDEGGDTAFVTMQFPSGVLGRLDLSRTHASGYNNETYVIGTKGTMQVGRFAGYPGPIPVEVWTASGELHPASQTFEMTYLTRPFPEFLPRFQAAYLAGHTDFRAAIAAGRPFAVSAVDALDAQVIVEAAHRSAADNRRAVRITRSDDLAAYSASCAKSGLLEQPHRA
jgi:myo-inositol 2-dehydrogenase / D-chiro-inositol 1-dehydrogenase